MTYQTDVAGRRPHGRKGPLAGLRVADFCWMGVGSLATRFLADFGAEVIKIENRLRLDTPRRLPIYKGVVRAYGHEDPNPDPNKGGLHNNYSRNKLGITVNMKTEKGREIVDRLIAASSVVTENFAPGVMERWGLTYDRLKELCPEVIFARMSGFGHTGPYHEYRSYGPVVQAACGMSFVSGLPGREPSGWGLSYMDNQAAYTNSAALLLAIYQRNRTGKGTEIDVSAVEAGMHMLGPILLDVSVNGRVTRGGHYPTGNRVEHPHAAPHGVYPARGDDRWLAIAVMNDAEWRALVEVMGNPSWAQDGKFATQEARFANQDDLDPHIAAWSRERDCHEAMDALQAAGVRAGAVQNAQDLNEVDPQIAKRGLFFELDHPVIGEARFEGEPMHFSRTGMDNWRSAPLLGEDNDYVYREILGYSAEEIDALAEEGVI
ncbi:MAG: CoA transferase [Alphaproteobacteria bacterium]|nr:CoA transferase [Alphaproteobacteria bacterium]